MHGIALILGIVLVGGTLAGCSVLAGPLVCPSSTLDGKPVALSAEARALVDQAFEGVDRSRLLDVHVHVAGLGQGGTGCWVNPDMRSLWHPVKRLQFEFYFRAAGIRDLGQADRQFVRCLVDRMRAAPGLGRCRILALDHRYRPDGTVDWKRTEFYVPNEYVLDLSEAFPDVFLPTISVHPYRPDALAELRRGAGRGATMVKWLPNSQGIDPSDPRCDGFYDAMRELGLALLVHCGEEKAVDAGDDQRLGNPLLLRRALDRGVRVVVAHCASLGTNVDLDDPARRPAQNFNLFLRLLAEERYRGLLFGDLSAVTQYNRSGAVLATLLGRTDLHERLLNGSDYPLPAINALIRTRSLESAGFITKRERASLNEIFRANPLLFDFVLKRTLRNPGGREGFPPSVFMECPALSRAGC